MTNPTLAPASRWGIPAARVMLSAASVAKDRDAWLRLRTTGVTATDARVLAGHGYANESEYHCWRAKVDPDSVRDSELPGPDKDIRLHLGTMIEPVLQHFSQNHLGIEIRNVGFLQSKLRPHFLASPDGQSSDGGGVEFKMPSESELTRPDPKGIYTNDRGYVLPIGWVDQTQWQLLVSGWSHIWVCALVVGAYKRVMTYWKVMPDLEYQAHLEDLAENFWLLVTTRTPPPPNFEDDDEIADRWPEAVDPFVNLDPPRVREVMQLIADRLELNAAAGAAKYIDNRLREIAGDAKEVRTTEGALLYRWGNVAGTVTDWEQFARDHPDIDLNAYRRRVPVHHRALSFPKPKGTKNDKH